MRVNKKFLIFGCIVIALISLLSFKSFAQQIFVPAKGNLWVTNDTDDQIDQNGIVGWQNPETILSAYVKVGKTGYFDLSLLASVAKGTSTVKVWLNNMSYSIDVSNTDQDTIMVGRFKILAPGYQQIKIQGASKTASNFANIEGLIISGEIIDSTAIFVKNDFYWGRRGPSVHLKYEVPSLAKEVVWFYNEITVPEGEDIIGSYFMANGFAEGYFGIQVNSENERRILFSVWSPYKTDDPTSIPEDSRILLLNKGEDVHTGEFGNEGSGGQSYLQYMWQAEKTYKFLLQGIPSVNNSTDYTAYFYAPELKKWLLIASFRRPKTSTYLKRPHSFLENFITETGFIRRKLYYSNQWVYDTNNKWHEITKATFTADATAIKGARMDYFGGVEGNTFFLENCGFFNRSLKIGTRLERKATETPPVIDFSSLLK